MTSAARQTTEVTANKSRWRRVLTTKIIAAINEKYGTNFTEMDKVLEQIQQDFLADEKLQ